MNSVNYKQFEQVLLPQYLERIASEMEQTGEILTITDNDNGTYTIGIGDILTGLDDLTLIEYSNIIISETTNFDGVYQIFNLTTTTFDISKAAGLATETGQWKQPVNFRFGTYVEIENELKADTNDLTKLVNLMCLIETNESQLNLDAESNELLKSKSLLAFLTRFDQAWKTRQNKEDFAIKPMFNLIYLFMDVADTVQGTATIRSQSLYGVEKDHQGHKEALIPNYSGMEIFNIDLTVYKTGICN